MMLVPIGHENMAARRWPVVTLSLIAINTIVFLLTTFSMHDEAPQLGEVRSDILILAALHPELKMHPEEQLLVDSFQKNHADVWKQIQNPYRDVISPYDAKIKMMEDPERLQQEMDSLNDQYLKLTASSVTGQYAFVPAHPTVLSYITANFLHGGWMHLIGNMLFLWIFGNNVEDYFGATKFSLFYILSWLAAIAMYSLFSLDSRVPLVGASGAIAGVMGAYLVLHPRARITCLIFFFIITFVTLPAQVVLGIWFGIQLLMALTGTSSGGGVAWLAHVGGFAFGWIVLKGLVKLRGGPDRGQQIYRIQW